MRRTWNAVLAAFSLQLVGVEVVAAQHSLERGGAGLAGEIICVRGKPRFYFDSEGSYSQYNSWESLCAQQRFGGAESFNLQGYCANWIHPRPRLFFDPTSEDRLGTRRSIDIDYLCQTKCFCSSAVRSTSNHLPRNEWPILHNPATTKIITADGRGSNTGYVGAIRYYPSILDTAYEGSWEGSSSSRSSASFTPSSASSASTPPRNNGQVLSTLVSYANDEGPFRAIRFDGIKSLRVSLHSRNKITCQGSLPPWTFEFAPLSTIEYRWPPRQLPDDPPIQRLCATALSGGHPDGNAGGLCLHNLAGQDNVPTVGFSDDWGAGDKTANEDSLDSLAVRLWCRRQCTCEDNDDRTAPRQTVQSQAIPGAGWDGDAAVEFTHFGVLIKHPDGRTTTVHPQGYRYTGSDGNTLSLSDKESSKTTTVTGSILRPHHDNGGASGKMVQFSDPKTAIDALARSSYPGPINIDVFTPSVQQLEQQKQCGGRCSSRRECSGTDCACAVDPDSVAKLGLDPVFPAAGCIALSLVQASVKNAVGRSGGLKLWGKREQRRSWPCVCNATYASPGCCESLDGIVWEDYGEKVGSLISDKAL